MILGADSELDFFDLWRGFCLVLFQLRLLIFVFAVVADFTDGWVCFGCDFYEVETVCLGFFQGFLVGHDAELVAVVKDNADFWRTDVLVDSREIATFAEWLSWFGYGCILLCGW